MKPTSALRLLRWVVLAFALAGLGRAGAQENHRLNLDEKRATLTATETALRDKNLDDSGFQTLRAQADALALTLQGAIAELTPRLADSAKRLDELTPKTGQPAPTTDVAAKDLANEKERHDRLDANLRAARAMLLEANDVSTRISAARRQLFAQRTFARSSSVLDPQLWTAVGRELPLDAEVVRNLAENWRGAIGERPLLAKIGMVAILIALALAAAPLGWIARRFVYRDLGEKTPSRLRRALAAAWTFVLFAALPLAALGVLAGALDSFNLFDPTMQGVLDAAFEAARVLIAVNALGRGLLAPERAAWRLVPISDRSAGILYRLAMTFAAIWAVERLVEPLADAAASLNLAVATRGVGAIIAAIALATAMRQLGAQPAGAQGSPQSEASAPLRTLGWAAALILFLAAATGYVAFSTFLINQAIYLSIVGAALYVADILAQDGTEAAFKPDGPIGARLVAMAGLRRNALAQISVVLQGVARVVVVMLAFGAVLKPWGVQSQDMFGALRSAYFGFSIGGVTLSLSSMVGAAVVFAVAVFFTRLIQNWLGSRFLPQTRLDSGVRNSVQTIAGYIGVIVAALLAGAQIGLDLQKVALIAGGLSVGIGFGLQTIANNFVSGLILLWDRTIRVGDLVVVGSDQGVVRAINARATEIETFDRSSLIVPNSNFVSGVVKNWVHNDRVGRLLISINVTYESDLDKVRDLLIAAAKAQDQVLAIPGPSVLFAEFGDWAMKFNLICFVEDIEQAERTRSDINFEVVRRLREAGLRIAYPAPPPADVPSRFEPEPKPAPTVQVLKK
jgi:potassium-dependent mechanosensitive channel